MIKELINSIKNKPEKWIYVVQRRYLEKIEEFHIADLSIAIQKYTYLTSTEYLLFYNKEYIRIDSFWDKLKLRKLFKTKEKSEILKKKPNREEFKLNILNRLCNLNKE